MQLSTPHEFVLPDPVIDNREEDLINTLTDNYDEFKKPGRVSEGLKQLQQTTMSMSVR